MEVHFSQRLILGEWSWSLHRATEKDATVAVYKSKNLAKIKHSTSERDKNWTGRQNRGDFFGSRCFSSLKTEMVRVAGFSAHSCVALELWLVVHHCTAVWLMAEGRRRKTKDKGKEVEKQ